jgi:hypothetical protein
MSESSEQQTSGPQTSDPQGGISSSGRNSGDFTPETQVPGDDYGNTGAETTQQKDAQDTQD